MQTDRNIVKRFARWCRSRRERAATANAPVASLLWPTIFIALACLMMLGLQGWIEWEARAAQARETEASLVNLATSLTQHADDTIDVADTVLAMLVEGIETDGTGPAALARINRKLAAQVAEAPRYRSVTVVDAHGDTIASSFPNNRTNVSAREYFIHHRDDPGRGPYISQPIRSHETGHWILAVTRRIQAADGSFAGVAFVSIELNYFANLYATYDIGSNGFISLLTTDGVLLARYPPVEKFIGQTFPNGALLRNLHEHPGGSFENTAIIDGVRRFTGYRRSDRYPLVAMAAMSEDQALAAWRAEACNHMAMILLLSGVLGLLGRHLIRLLMRFQAAEEQALEREIRYRLLADHANDIVTRVGPDGLRQYVSRAAMRIIGVPPSALLGSKMLDYVHPDDRPDVLDRIGKLATGKTEPQPPRFRILRPDGVEIWIEASSQVLTHPTTGAPDGYVSTLRDVTAQVEAQAKLSDSEARYRLLADNSTDMIVVVDRQFIRRYVSPSCREILGFEPEELVGLSGELMLHPEDAARVMTAVDQLLASREHSHDRIIYRLRHHDGHWVWVELVRKVLYSDVTGEPTGLCCVLRDISERMAAEAALRGSEERFRLLLESSVIEAIYMLDPDGNIETWNGAAERIKGYAPAEIIGKNFAVFFTPEDAARGEPARALGIARDTGRFEIEVWRVRKDGSHFLARVAISAIRRDDGTLRGFAAATHDITTQRIEEEQRAIIIEAAPNGMMIVDEAGVITLANSQLELVFGYPSGTLVGESVDILVPEAFRVAHGALRSAFTSRRTDQAMRPERQFTGRKRDGSAVTIEIMLSPVRTPRGRIVVASLFDITERTRRAAEEDMAEALERAVTASTNASVVLLAQHLEVARDEAEEASQAKSRFLAGITHELRTPLHGILGYAELLSLEGDLNTTQTERLEAMMAAGQHLLGTINAVLDMSQIEADQIELQPVEIELPGLVRACLDVVRPAAEAKGLALLLAPTAPLRLFADPDAAAAGADQSAWQCGQVHAGRLGRGAAATDGRRRHAFVWKSPIPARGSGSEHRDKLFQTFERLNAEAVSGIEGSGLGLAIAAHLVRLMGGRIGYDDNPGGGSVFWVELPSGAGAPAEVAVAAPPPRPSGGACGCLSSTTKP